jgi:transposase
MRFSRILLSDVLLPGLIAIGVDEISSRRRQRYLTSIADHGSGSIVWRAPGPQRRCPAGVSTNSMSASKPSTRSRSTWPAATTGTSQTSLPDDEICFDPVHVARVRHEELSVRAGCGTPPAPGCRGDSVKPRAA